MGTIWRMVFFLSLALLAGHAMAGQTVQTYYVDNRWDGGNEASLPHLRSAGEGCISVLRADMRAQQKSHPNNQWRYRLLNVGTDDGFSEFGCGGSVDELVTGVWSPIDTFGVSNNYVFEFFGSVDCPAGDVDPETGQCGPPKQPCCEAATGDGIDASSGNKHLVETDHVGGGAFPLRFERTYDSDRTWLNQPVPLGVGWMHNYMAAIYFMPDQGSGTITQAVAYRPDGTILRFNLSGGVWTADNDVAVRLSATIDGNNIASATITTTDDAVEQYDGIGRLVSITSRDGLKQTLSYVSTSGAYANDVQKVTDPQGHTLSFGYNANSQLSSVTDGNGAIIQYGYDGNGNLTSAVFPDAGGGTKTRTYSYDEASQVAGTYPHSLTGIADETSTPGVFQRYGSWNYDSEGRTVLSVHGPWDTGTIDRTSLAFHGDGTTGFTDALGQQRNYGFDVNNGVAHPASLDVACDGCAAHDRTRGYDGNGYPDAGSDFNDNQTTYTYATTDGNGHPRGLQTQRVEGIPPAGDPVPDVSAERTINTQWHASFRVPVQEDVLDHAGTTVQTTKWSYNSRGQPLFRCLVDPAVAGASAYTCGSLTNAPAGVRQWAWTWCESGGGCPLVGLVLTAKGPRTDIANDVTRYAYYASTDLSGCATGGACHYLGDLQTVTDALGHVTSHASYDGDGRPTRILDPNGVPTDLIYHPRGWLSQRAVRNAGSGTSSGDRITTWTFDIVGNPLQITQPAGDYRIFGYDNAHRLTDISNKANEHLHYALDAAGNHLEEDSYNSTASLKHRVLNDYDVLGHRHHAYNAYATPVTVAMTYDYDGNGNVRTATDGRSHVTSNTYDPRNRLVQTEQDATGLKVFIEYAYDPLDRLVDVEDPQGLHTSYTFDGLGNLKQLASPDTGITTYGHDAAGNRTSQLDARNKPAVHAYDALNRLTGITYSLTPSLNVTYNWDVLASGCPTSNHFVLGRMAQVTDNSGSTQFCYDRFGETVQKIATIATGIFPVKYSWNRDGMAATLTAPKGTQITYARDKAQRIKSVSYQLDGQASATTLVSAVGYLPFGPASKITYGNGRSLSRNYDLDYVARGVVDDSAAGDGLNLTFGRDAVGNLSSIRTSDTVGNKLVYDGLNRLVRVNDLSDNPHWHYTYDGTGNRLSEQQGTQTAVSYTYPLDSHHLLAVGATTRQYDAAGNTQQIGTDASRLNFIYDDTGRMNQVQVGGVQAKAYLTNALGQRVRKSKAGDSSQTVKTVYDESGHVLGDFDNANAIVDEYVWMDDLPVGVVDGASSTVKYIEPDHLGSPRTAIDPLTNHAIWNWPILDDPFGKGQPVNLNGSTLTLNLRFPWQVHDAESGMNYSYFRDYDPGTGRYLQSDPSGMQGGAATYAYASSTPIARFDSRGPDPVGIGCADHPGPIACDGKGN